MNENAVNIANPPQLAAGAARWRSAVAVASLALLTFLVYLPSLRGGFIWDDLLLVNENPLVKGEFTLRTIWFATDFPLSNVALWLEWLAFGKNAAGYRGVNLLLHLVSCLLLWRLLARLRIPGGAWAAALFAVHPVAAGSVAWISEIKNTLSLPFYLASLWFYFQAEARRDLAQLSGARWFHLLSLLAFLLALLTKTSTVGLPVVILALLWWQHGRITKLDALRTAPHFGIALAFGLMTVWFQSQQTLAGFKLPSESITTKLAAAGMAVWFYLGKALLPLQLSAVYPRWELDSGSVTVYLPMLALALTAATAWWLRRSWGKHALLALLCWLASLFPILGLFDMYFLAISRVSDHFQYLALIVPLVAIAAGITSLRRPLLVTVLTGTLVLGLSVLAAGRTRVYATDESLWRDTLARNPAAWTGHNNLGCILAEQNDLAAAAEHFVTSLKLNPRNASAHVNFGKVLLLRNDLAPAEEHFREALALKPNQPEALRGLGQALAARGRHAEAVDRLREAQQLKPDSNTRLQLAQLLSSLGRSGEAVTELRAVLATQPASTAGLQNLAWILATSADEKVRDGAAAVRLAEKACDLTARKDARMLSALAAAYAEAGQFPKAIAAAQQAIELAQAAGEPKFAQVNAQLLRFYQAGRPYHEPPTKR